MKIDYVTEIEAAPQKVWYWLGTPERAMTWQTSVEKTEILTKTPDWVGTTFRETVEEVGRGTEMRGVVTDYVEGQSLGMHLTGDYNVVDIAWHLEPLGTHARLTVHADVRFKAMLRVMSILLRPVFRSKMAAQLHADTARLKEMCERSG